MMPTISILICLALTGIAAGPALTNLHTPALRQSIGWIVLTCLVTAAHFALLTADPFFRMVGLCCVLMASMKGLVYAVWSDKETLPLSRYAVFAFLWFGMDPGTFRIKRAKLSWKHDVALGTLLILLGIAGAWLIWKLEWQQVFLMFLPLSLSFHFGILRILKGLLRRAGFPVRTLFPNPLKTRGIADFWSRRWNVGYSQMMQRIVGRPIESKLGKRAGLMAIFIASGLLHEIAITLPTRSGFGLPTLYFTLHGILILLEKTGKKPIGPLLTWLALILPLGCLFPPTFQSEIIQKCLNVFSLLSG